MRDGNTPHHISILLPRGRFGSSYEGWKLSGIKSHTTAPLGFGSSYEGWKRKTHLRRKNGSRRFGSSYEGWKRGISVLEMWQLLVLDLPMRDGNSGTQLEPAEQEHVLDLPMRDGNCAWLHNRPPWSKFWIFL